MKNSFLIYADYEQYFDMLSPIEQAKLMKALFKAFRGENTVDILNELEGMTKMAFAFMFNKMETDNKKYEQKCETNRQNGSAGGEKKRAQANATERLSEEAIASDRMRTPPDKDKDKEIDKDLEKENIKEKAAEMSTAPDVFINKNIPPKGENTVLTDSELLELIEQSFSDTDVKNKFRDYANMRAAQGKNKAIRTRATFQSCVSKLRKYAKSSKEAVEILDNSIINNWTGIFELKKQSEKSEEIEYAN